MKYKKELICVFTSTESTFTNYCSCSSQIDEIG